MKNKSSRVLFMLVALFIQSMLIGAAPSLTAAPTQPVQVAATIERNPKLRALLMDLGMANATTNGQQIFLPLVNNAIEGNRQGNEQKNEQGDISAAEHTPPRWPEARGYHRLVYSAEVKRVLMVGGEAHSGWNDNLPGYGGLWSLDTRKERWQKEQAAIPFAVDWVAYDEESERIIAYVSFHPPATPDDFPELVSETWAYDVKQEKWENRNPSTHPPLGLLGGGSQMAYDRDVEKVIMFGGLDLSILKKLLDTGDASLLTLLETNNTWAYDYESNQWINRQPANPPPGRNSHAFVYDQENKSTLLFGGGDAFVNFGDTWAYGYEENTWTELKPLIHPSPRAYGYMAYDERVDRILLFGGVDYTETEISGETWLYDPKENSWTQQHPTTAPSPRGWYDTVYSPKSKGIILFGGGTDRYHFTDELWLYQAKANRWVQVTKP